MFKSIINFFRYGSRTSGGEGADGRESVDATDAMAAVVSHPPSGEGFDNVPIGGGMPPNYVKSYDEGRPRK